MSKMKMLRFTAEASLYQTDERYNIVRTFDTLAGGTRAIPQQASTQLPPGAIQEACGPTNRYSVDPSYGWQRCWFRNIWGNWYGMHYHWYYQGQLYNTGH